MHTTFYLLLRRSRNLGSSFWLPLAIISSAVLALLLALPIAMALKIPIDPVALTEALPFLVCTVGFDKPLRLARAVFGHEHLLIPPGVNGNAPLAVPTSSHHHHQLKPAPKIITESLSQVYPPIIRDYILEIAVLTVGAYSKVGGLKEVCALAALILAIDCLLLCTYLAAVLGVMVEVSVFCFLSRVGIFAVACSFLGLTASLDPMHRCTAY
jgi:hydroxymethylglutaryl-CoA reductase (NADPH)